MANENKNRPTGLPKRPAGPSLIEMLTSHVRAEGTQDEPELTEDLWYPTEGMAVGPGDTLDSNPDQEGPRWTE